MKNPDYFYILPNSLSQPLRSAGYKNWADVVKKDETTIRGLPGIGQKGIMRLNVFKKVFGHCTTIDEVERGAWQHRQARIDEIKSDKNKLICKCGQEEFLIDKMRLELICPICGEDYCYQGEIVERWY